MARIDCSRTCAACARAAPASEACLQNHAGGGLPVSPPPADRSFARRVLPALDQRSAARPFGVTEETTLSSSTVQNQCRARCQARLRESWARSETSFPSSQQFRLTRVG